MPQFILEVGGASARRAFHALDEFTQGYIEALFFTESEPSITMDDVEADREDWRERTQAGEIHEIPSDVGFAELAPETLADIIADCTRFQAVNAALLQRAYDQGMKDGPYDAMQAGRDFWFTRNGHGVGFWDRGLGPVGKELSAACGWRTKFGELNAYLSDDNLVYLS